MICCLLSTRLQEAKVGEKTNSVRSNRANLGRSLLHVDTVAVLWRRSQENGELHRCRVKFSFVPFVIADIDDQRDEVDQLYLRSDMKDEDGTLDMKKITEAQGAPWYYE